MNIAVHLGAETPCRGNIIKMLCAQLKTLRISEGAAELDEASGYGCCTTVFSFLFFSSYDCSSCKLVLRFGHMQLKSAKRDLSDPFEPSQPD